MKKNRNKTGILLGVLLSAALALPAMGAGFASASGITASAAASTTLTVDPSQSKGAAGDGIHEVSDKLYGIFFEDINHAADGGMSAEKVINQSFEYSYIKFSANSAIIPDNQRFWNIYRGTEKMAEKKQMSSGGMSENNPTYLRIKAKVPGYRLYNVGNQGDDFDGNNTLLTDDFGMSMITGDTFTVSFYARQNKSDPFVGNIKLNVKDKKDNDLTDTASVAFTTQSAGEWTQYSAKIAANKTALGALNVEFDGIGMLDMDFFSLMPDSAYGVGDPRWTSGKIRREIIDVFKDMKPQFLRFPGGCVAEGTGSWENVYNWKNTVGDLTQRVGTPNLWEYWQSYNIGFYEYFLLCEDLGMEPMPVVDAGMICQARMGDAALIYTPNDPEFKEEVVDMALDLIYFCKGSTSSADPDEAKWAKIRVDMGHPGPFALNMISLGNENWGEAYWANFAAAKSMLENYNYDYYKNNPTDMLKKWDIQIVTTSGTDVWGTEYKRAWKVVNGESATKATEAGLYKDLIVDEHYYNSAKWYIDNSARYDAYDRSGAKVFVGEYSANGGGGATVNTLEAALAEAAFMTGLERNGDVVVMASYAPFFGKAGNYNWATNAVWLNAKNIMLTPNYYVQKMFGENVGGTYIPDKNFSLTNVYQSITYDQEKDAYIVKLVNTSSLDKNIQIDLTKTEVCGTYYGTMLQNDNNQVRNTFADNYDGDAVYGVQPQTLANTTFDNKTAAYTVKKYSVSVLTFPCNQLSADAELSGITIFGKSVEGFDSGKTEYVFTLADEAPIPYVFASANSPRASVSIQTDVKGNRETAIVVTAESGAQKTYTIRYQAAQPSGNEEKKGCGCSSALSAVGGTMAVGGALSALGLACLIARRRNRKGVVKRK